ncbi:related to ECM32 - DNA dependent ATPase/DNA helicase B [Cephalotrichum gorgonifer]|uniref:Related to ECM32 - DNA dependent ATPase/DNA helicase B n=1 Tax=Cephalotrichum gorgonifer TaxID=2041049 RepID=A0AAE8SZU4_9PEZI|nr:related to ECM32 - DNA dependent ATPase/DNA helicase B [Cephalotrichum gorgonifer]
MALNTGKQNSKNPREIKLRNQLHLFLKGKRNVDSVLDAQHFLEAVCLQDSPSTCIEQIISSKHGLSAIHNSLRRDLSREYIQNYASRFLLCLSDPVVKALNSGLFLHMVLKEVIEPSSFWDALVACFEKNELDVNISEPLAWLCLELLSLPTLPEGEVVDTIRTISHRGSLLQSANQQTRSYAYKLEKSLRLLGNNGSTSGPGGPGGRHDNDFEDFRKIAIYPTRDELLFTEAPYYRLASDVAETPVDERAKAHLENQFRLLREDMLGELRSDIQIALGIKKRGRRTATVLGGISVIGVDFQTKFNADGRVSILVHCAKGLERLSGLSEHSRKAFLSSQPGFLKHQSFGAFCCGKELLAFGFIWKDEAKLLRTPPVVEIQIPDIDALRKVLGALFQSKPLDFALVDTAVFAYEPVLKRLKCIKELPLDICLLDPSRADAVKFEPKPGIQSLIEDLKAQGSKEGCKIVGQPVDGDQVRSIVDALRLPVSAILGPPGTGKSYVGALIVSAALNQEMRVLVLSYTNHALDQFLMDLIKVGISRQNMVRLGSKSTEKTAGLSLEKQLSGFKSKMDWAAINTLRDSINELKEYLNEAVEILARPVTSTDVLGYLEFDDRLAHTALTVPSEVLMNGQGKEGFATVGKRGKTMDSGYLLDRWKNMKPPNPFSDRLKGDTAAFWKMPKEERVARFGSWVQSIKQEQIDDVSKIGFGLSEEQKSLETLMTRPKRALLEEKKVIGCTTTAAAKYPELISAANADMVLVEEAGEILEAHVLTALAPSVKQLVLIGDHKQLRPKINTYNLSVEQGSGYDLNRSLFERLILQGYRYSQLNQQHRMHPDISAFPRALTYPELKDGPRTFSRAEPLGLRGRVVFVNHEKPEEDFATLSDRRDNGAVTSKQNTFEAAMVLRLVKYLGQQGYGTDQLVILTPYLAQLRLLREILSRENDPLLTDLDSYELRRAGLLTRAAAKVDKKKIRISTIDNYQGEESDVVVISLTRSNSRGDIGFLSSPERLNVVLTRARQAVIMIGHMDTFLASKKGGGLWKKLFNLLKEGGYLYDGVPVRCQQHPDTTSLLASPEDFDKYCPEGGCTKPCNAPLPCGLHRCDRRCHRVRDHSMVTCSQLVEKNCARNHKTRSLCRDRGRPCADCEKEDKDIRRRAERDLELEMQRRVLQASYERELDRTRDELDHERRLMKNKAKESELKQTIENEKAALKGMKEARVRMEEQKKRQEAQDQKKKAAKVRLAKERKDETTKSKKEDGQWRAPDTANEEWEYMKRYEGQSSAPLDALMGMIGLEAVKAKFLGTKSRVDTAIRQDVSLAKERFSCSLLGNPGTGKTTVARLYGQFLTSVGVIPGTKFEETTGSKLANMGVQGCQDLLEEIQNGGGGVLFIDEAYQLSSGNSPGGKAVLDFLLAEVENLTGKVVFVLAGYTKQMESFFAHNPGLPSRFPIQMKFDDYTDEELLQILKLKVEDKFGGRMAAEGTLDGLYCRIVSRRLGRGRGREGFGNARDVENAVVRICNRQSDRIRREKRSGVTPDYLLLTKEDLIGPEPSAALHGCKAWEKLNSLIGLRAVKDAVRVLVDTMQANCQRELAEEPPVEYTLNKVFLGSPGTGKTTVAKFYGEILVSLGILSNGEVVVKNPSDFVGSHLGQSEQVTKGILASTIGKVLVIDEAYGLYGGPSNGTGGTSDIYRTAVVDTIVAEVQSTPGEDRCVLLLGYREQMEGMFQNVNPGLSRRFPIASAFIFEDFTQEELARILDLKLSQSGFMTTDKGKQVALEVLDRARNRPNFGNAGEIDILLNDAKARHQKRFSTGKTKRHDLLDAVDFDEEFDRGERSETNIRMLFKDTVGCGTLVSLLEGYQSQVRAHKEHGLDPKEGVPFTFLFRGPPGTGKTSTARKMGKVFYDMGFLAKAEVVECSASNLVGQYVGHTGLTVRSTFDKALGRVLFIDEAYRLAEGSFAKEAVDEIVDSLTKEKYMGKMVVILAGYDDDINRLLSVNPGLSSRFPDVISFSSLAPGACIELLRSRLQQKRAKMKTTKATLDLSVLEKMDPGFERDVSENFMQLSMLKGWANARDVETLAMHIFRRALKADGGGGSGSGGGLVVSEDIVRSELTFMLDERRNRDAVRPSRRIPLPFQFQGPPTLSPAPTTSTSTATSTSTTEAPPAKPPAKQKPSDEKSLRDAGVSDEVWAQLELDKKAEAAREKNYQALQRKLADESSEALRAKILDELIEEEERRQVEAAKRKKLEAMGLCPAGYSWIKQEGGYRCAGGSHFVGDGDVDWAEG